MDEDRSIPAVDGPARTERLPERGGPPPPAAAPLLPGRRPLLVGAARTLLTSAGLLVVYFALPLDRAFTAGTVAALAAGVGAVGLLVAWQVRAILRAPHPALRAVEGVALSVPLFLLLFAIASVQLSGTDPGAFTEPLSRVDGLYFVVTVFATVGFGDIAPVSEAARLLTTVQMVVNLVVIGLVLRVFLAAVDRRRRAAADPDPPPDAG
ncbi:potassium channel family protein [Geodermatophilus sp. SYSU D00697]